MKENLVPEADGLKFTEKKGLTLGDPEGGEPANLFERRSIRKRGYFRALKAGAPWALYERACRDVWIKMFHPDAEEYYDKMIGLGKLVQNDPS